MKILVFFFLIILLISCTSERELYKNWVGKNIKELPVSKPIREFDSLGFKVRYYEYEIPNFSEIGYNNISEKYDLLDVKQYIFTDNLLTVEKTKTTEIKSKYRYYKISTPVYNTDTAHSPKFLSGRKWSKMNSIIIDSIKNINN